MGLRRKKVVEEVKNCPQCGAEYHGYPEFCEECGYDFASPELAEEPAEKAENPAETDENVSESTEEQAEPVEEPAEKVEEAVEIAEDPVVTDDEPAESDEPFGEEEVELTSWEDLDADFEDEDILDDEQEDNPDLEFDEDDIDFGSDEEIEEDSPEFEDDIEEDNEPDNEFEEGDENTALENFEKESLEVNVEQLDFSEAIEGPEIIAYETEEGFKVVTAPKELIVECLVCDENTAKILKADHRLYREEELSTKDLAEIYSFLKENSETVKSLFGCENLNEWYGNSVDLYADMINISDELLDTELGLDVLAALAKTTKEQQKLVAKVISSYGFDKVTVASAKQIADGKKTEEEIKNILLQDERMFEILKYTTGM